ncbi:hypothetical protein OHB44_28020 [Micromonospora sp. NBC_00821]|uniref:hypothetical protein n=1 Tax=Micromonospora sp. NBC_00821 TaxID=2975977 RepID=UPI002ECFDC0C|nr:hypothetical protein OHB44_28020 [Micromonospora sp. NBC_00821]
MKLLPPMRFRFHEDDHERYGSDWWVYDEAALVRVPARQLVEIEQQIGMGVRDMCLGVRTNLTFANLASMWVVRKLAGVDEDFASFEPLVWLADWEPAPATDVDPPASTSSTSPPSAEA